MCCFSAYYVLFFSILCAVFQHIMCCFSAYYVLFFSILCAVFQHIMCCFSAYYVLFFSILCAVFQHIMCCFSAYYVLFFSILCAVFQHIMCCFSHQKCCHTRRARLRSVVHHRILYGRANCLFKVGLSHNTTHCYFSVTVSEKISYCNSESELASHRVNPCGSYNSRKLNKIKFQISN